MGLFTSFQTVLVGLLPIKVGFNTEDDVVNKNVMTLES